MLCSGRWRVSSCGGCSRGRKRGVFDGASPVGGRCPDRLTSLEFSNHRAERGHGSLLCVHAWSRVIRSCRVSRKLVLAAGQAARTASARVLLGGGADEETGETLTARVVAERVGWRVPGRRDLGGLARRPGQAYAGRVGRRPRGDPRWPVPARQRNQGAHTADHPLPPPWAASGRCVRPGRAAARGADAGAGRRGPSAGHPGTRRRRYGQGIAAAAVADPPGSALVRRLGLGGLSTHSAAHRPA